MLELPPGTELDEDAEEPEPPGMLDPPDDPGPVAELEPPAMLDEPGLKGLEPLAEPGPLVGLGALDEPGPVDGLELPGMPGRGAPPDAEAPGGVLLGELEPPSGLSPGLLRGD